MQDQTFRTSAASAYIKSVGVLASSSYLEKCRARGNDDLRDRGPDFYRDQRGICWYSRDALDHYAAQRLAARQFRAPAPQPAQFRRDADQAA
jgi:hypothetical protein